MSRAAYSATKAEARALGLLAHQLKREHGLTDHQAKLASRELMFQAGLFGESVRRAREASEDVKLGVHTGSIVQSPRRKRREAAKRREEEARWASLNGPVIVKQQHEAPRIYSPAEANT